MSKTHPETKDTAFGGRKLILALLAASFLVLPGSSCGSNGGVTEPPTDPGWSIETSSPGEQTIPTESLFPTEPSAEPTTQTTEATTEPVTEPGTEPTVEPTRAPTEQSITVPTEEPTEPTEPSVPETIPPMEIQISPNNTEVLLIPKNAQAFVQRDLTQPVEYDIYNYKTVYQRLDTGVSVPLSVKITNLPQGVEITSLVFTLADNPSLINGQTFQPVDGQKYVKVPFLLANKQYYYRVCISFSNGTTRVLESGFRTAAAPRLLSIDGIVNVRDIGGWKTTDGYVIRQGLLYRGGELDGAVKPEYLLSAEGVRQMRQELRIRTDMDLRYPGEIGLPTSPLGTDVEYIVYDAPSYIGIFTDYGRQMVRTLFADLADESKYPVYLHCTYGVDRTGTLCYLLEALLGVSEADLQREYELSTLYHTWVDTPGFQSLVAELNRWDGNTLQEKTENFLLECGVTRQQIAAIRDIFLEKA